VARARRAICAFARECGFDGGQVDDIESAVGEALANAVEHGHRPGGSFSVGCTFDGARLVIDVKDGGPGFDFPRPFPTAPPELRLRGFGSLIMQALMDEVWYSERGTRVRLIKMMPALSQRPAELLSAALTPPAAAPSVISAVATARAASTAS